MFKKITLLIFIIMLVACSNKSEEKNSKIQTDEPAKRKPILSISDKVLYEDEFFEFAEIILREMDRKDFENADVQKYLFDDFIEHNLLLVEANRREITIKDERVSTILDSFKTPSGVQDLKVYSGSYATDHNKLAKIMQNRLLVESLLNNVVSSSIVITEQDMQYYYKNSDTFQKRTVKAHILHIFNTDNETIRKARAELRKGISFNEVAGRYSESPEKIQGGDLGLVSDDDFPEIFEVAFKLKAGQISDIVQSDYGFHIFMVKRFEKSKPVNYDSVKSKIYFELYSKKQEEITREFLNELYTKNNVKVINSINFHNFTDEGKQ